ncbi:MAG: hypothetical protein LBP59_10355 [Planctomycetaceae bacterium]|jgi:DNA 3'-phosphatase|nr:hypothetical protein [Planctomycetaceae bacterium]
MNKKLLYLDLDNTIIETISGDTFPRWIGDLKFKDGFLPALTNFVVETGVYYIWITSNQGGIEKGFVDAIHFRKKLEFVCAAVEDYCEHDERIKERYGDVIQKKIQCDGVFAPTNNPDDPMRKPHTGMLEVFFATGTHPNNIGKDEMIMIGDASGLEGQIIRCDKDCAANYGIDYLDVNDFIDTYFTHYEV